jgi:hypothetical protein
MQPPSIDMKHVKIDGVKIIIMEKYWHKDGWDKKDERNCRWLMQVNIP